LTVIDFTFPRFLENVTLELSPVNPLLDAVEAEGVLWRAGAGRFFIEVPEVARYLAEKGVSLSIEPFTGSCCEKVVFYLKMVPMAAIIFQRGLVALHASAITDGNRTILIAGDSGSGKSSLAAALMVRGWSILADDLAVVSLDGAGKPVIHPTFPELVLRKDTSDRLGIDTTQLPSLGENRIRLARQHQFTTQLPLSAVYLLSLHNREDVGRTELENSKAFHILREHLYNSRIADAILDKGAYLRIAAAVARHIPLIRLQRPMGTWSLNQMANFFSQEQP